MASLTFSSPSLHRISLPPISSTHSKASFLPVCAAPTSSWSFTSSQTLEQCSSTRDHTHLMRQKRMFHRFIQQVVKDSASLSEPTVQESTPTLVIDQESDPDATVVELSIGNGLAAFLGAMRELKDLGLTVARSRISVEGEAIDARFSLIQVDTGHKIDDPKILDAIRHSIVDNKELATVKSDEKPKEKPTTDVAMHVKISEAGPHRSLLFIEAANKPGLLREILRRLTDVQISFSTVDYETEGPVARANLFVNHRGAGLSEALRMVLTSYLRYYLARLLGLKKIERGPVDPFADD